MIESARLPSVPLDPKTSELIALGSAVAVHCQECFDRHFRQALHLEISLDQIEAAIKVAQTVRSIAAQDLDTHILCKIAATRQPSEIGNGVGKGI